MAHLHIETPLFESRPLTLRTGKEIWLKFESMQPTGSFKIRGIGLACQDFVRRGAKRFVSSSGGNAGIAVAYAGRRLSVPVVVVVPETTTNRAKAFIQNEGAELIVHGTSWHEANTLALSITSIATSLGARQVCNQAYMWSKTYPIKNVVVSDKSAIAACERFIEDHQVVVEPACGASLAAVYDNVPELSSFSSVLVIVCGGVTSTIAQLQRWSKNFV